MATRPQEDKPNYPESQEAKYYARAPRVIVELLDLTDIRERWGFGEDRIWRAVARGQLHAYGRPGHQKYYSAAELIAVFGEPGRGPNRPAKMERTEKGGNQERFDFAERDIAEAA